MPIITGNKPIFRVRLGDVKLREVKKGDDLTWGLYEITYINKGPKDVEEGFYEYNNVPNYVWGYPDYNKSISDGTIEPNDFNLYIPEDATAVESYATLGPGYGYKSHAIKWYDDNACLNYIPAVTKDFYKDLSLYCKWKQRRYTFNGTYAYDKEEETVVTIPAEAKVNNSTGEVMEIWIYGRTVQVYP